MLSRLKPVLVSKEEKCFIQGRNVKGCICLSSKAINLLHKKTCGGNLAIKIDITKVFDTIS